MELLFIFLNILSVSFRSNLFCQSETGEKWVRLKRSCWDPLTKEVKVNVTHSLFKVCCRCSSPILLAGKQTLHQALSPPQTPNTLKRRKTSLLSVRRFPLISPKGQARAYSARVFLFDVISPSIPNAEGRKVQCVSCIMVNGDMNSNVKLLRLKKINASIFHPL